MQKPIEHCMNCCKPYDFDESSAAIYLELFCSSECEKDFARQITEFYANQTTSATAGAGYKKGNQ